MGLKVINLGVRIRYPQNATYRSICYNLFGTGWAEQIITYESTGILELNVEASQKTALKPRASLVSRGEQTRTREQQPAYPRIKSAEQRVRSGHNGRSPDVSRQLLQEFKFRLKRVKDRAKRRGRIQCELRILLYSNGHSVSLVSVFSNSPWYVLGG